jgi:hypothetical protein
MSSSRWQIKQQIKSRWFNGPACAGAGWLSSILCKRLQGHHLTLTPLSEGWGSRGRNLSSDRAAGIRCARAQRAVALASNPPPQQRDLRRTRARLCHLAGGISAEFGFHSATSQLRPRSVIWAANTWRSGTGRGALS